jgi:hypothetical protein
MLGVDDALDAFETKNMATGCDDGVMEVVKAERTVITGLYGELEHLLERLEVFRGEVEWFFGIEIGEELGDAVAAELPMIADLAETK